MVGRSTMLEELLWCKHEGQKFLNVKVRKDITHIVNFLEESVML